MPKRLSRLTVVLVMLVAVGLPASARAFPSILVDVGTGQVLEHHDAFKRWYPASLTKLMLLYVVFNELRSGKLTLDSPVTMSKRAVSQPPAKMYLKPGATMTLDSAIKIIMTKSANDVAMAIAESVGGSERHFVDMMNAEAKQIGLISTHFINPNGLPGPGQYSTVRDMALLAMDLRREFPQYAFYFDLEGVEFEGRDIPNYNLLIGRFRGADGMKTGFICAAGFNQVSTATRNGRTLLAVAFGTPSLAARAEETAKLLHEGFTEHPQGGPTLKTLQPYGADRNVVADISDRICTPKAHKARMSARGEDGKVVISVPYIREMTHQPNYVPVRLISTGGIAPVVLSNVPIPSPRPDTGSMPASATAFAPVDKGDGAAGALRAEASGAGVPVPSARPGR